MKIEVAEVPSPIGDAVVACLEDSVVALRFREGDAGILPLLRRRFEVFTTGDGPHAAAIAVRLRGYFAGDLHALDGITVDTGGTPFQRAVWAQLRRIPPGQTASYREIATAIGAPSATRAVGAANGANPVGIIVPCHRVIGANGTLTGYGGGLDRKRWLLEHEGALFTAERTPP